MPPKMISVKAGGAVLFRHDLWHGAAKNSSDRRRYLIQVHYAEGSRRPAGDPITRPEFFAPEVLEKVPPRAARTDGRTAAKGYMIDSQFSSESKCGLELHFTEN